jgi:colanic acid biosynthesis glycosyl transferase WcaI
LRFLFLTQYFPPEIGGPQTRLQSMARQLLRIGHEVEVVTALPNYPLGRFFDGYTGKLYLREVRDAITVHRVWLYPALGGGLRRVLNYLSFSLTCILGLLRAAKPDYLLVESPPLTLSVPAFIFSRLWRIPFIFNVADLWPDAAVDTGFLKDGFLLRSLLALEGWSYHRATFVNAVTEGIGETLCARKKVPPAKLLFLPNGADTIHFRPAARDEALLQKLDLSGKKIVLWAGTLGHAHGLEFVLRAAKLLSDRSDIHFLFVGDGSAKKSLQGLAAELSLCNVTFRDPVSLESLPAYFSITDCGLASLRSAPTHDGARPSKIFPVLASGKPLIFVGRGECARLLRQANAGIDVEPENPRALAQAIVSLLDNRALLSEFGRNGREYVERHLDWSILIAAWTSHLLQAAPARGSLGVRTDSPDSQPELNT